ncbi:hypothetical protein B0T26DRAFT_671029 [Lasiosphaeria miniovina]|uniref:RRM domain-containing protein n=1 Tax=Lasiosphaeria miniovina TaxID=1954250 RepID=A0AA40BIE2_9PEZI|nr:uncharacterized protein B0T26DRAFT_671029 [Lasiosphaeria miniovina]KAK0734788.1 hypothetical protein B0T26DRAFT_671029 [Lasiosphaeria miniovina]
MPISPPLPPPRQFPPPPSTDSALTIAIIGYRPRRASPRITLLTSPEQPKLGSQALNTPLTRYSGLAYTTNAKSPAQPLALGSDFLHTTLVIKNTPFHIRKEIFLGIITELGLPLPHAFNYHFRDGLFRGLAFANFDDPLDAQYVFGHLDSHDIQGRRIRVEYKKKLPPHQRERLDRARKAKRGQLEEQHRPVSSSLPKLHLNNPDTLSFDTELALFRSDPNREIIVFPSIIVTAGLSTYYRCTTPSKRMPELQAAKLQSVASSIAYSFERSTEKAP